jgi:hypothetical protein
MEPNGQLRPGQSNLSARRAVVTQRMLARFVRLIELGRELRELRAEILKMLGGGAAVEPGPLDAVVEVTECRRLTISGLSALIGEENVRFFMSHLTPKEYRRLVVDGADFGAGSPLRPRPNSGGAATNLPDQALGRPRPR